MIRRQQQATPPPRRKGTAADPEWLVVPAVGEAWSGKFGRHRIVEMTGLSTRDLRVLDPLLSYPATILGRDRAVIVNLEHVKAVVTATEVLVRDPGNPSLSTFIFELKTRLALLDTSTTNLASDHGDEAEEGEGNGPRHALSRAGSAKIVQCF